MKLKEYAEFVNEMARNKKLITRDDENFMKTFGVITLALLVHVKLNHYYPSRSSFQPESDSVSLLPVRKIGYVPHHLGIVFHCGGG